MLLTSSKKAPLKSTLTECWTLIPIAFGVTITFLSQLTISVIEFSVIARTGAIQLAGASLAIAAVLICFLFSLGVVTAITPLVATARGRDDTAAERVLAQHGILMGLLISIVLAAMQFIIGIFLCLYYPDTEDYRLYTGQYLVAAAPGLVPWTVYVALRSLSIALNRTMVSTIGMVASVPFNAVLTVLLVNGFGKFSGLGIWGASISYSITGCAVVALVVVVAMLTGADEMRRVLAAPCYFSATASTDVLKLGFPFAIRSV